MKKTFLSIVSILVLSCAGAFAFTSGRAGAGINYSHNDGNNYFGLSLDHIGFIDEGSSFGLYTGADADFEIGDVESWNISLLAGPAYRYDFANSLVSCDLAAGISAACDTDSVLSLGLGVYIGAAFNITDNMELFLGTKLGSNFVDIPLDDPSLSSDKDFYVIPQIGLGFTY